MKFVFFLCLSFVEISFSGEILTFKENDNLVTPYKETRYFKNEYKYLDSIDKRIADNYSNKMQEINKKLMNLSYQRSCTEDNQCLFLVKDEYFGLPCISSWSYYKKNTLVFSKDSIDMDLFEKLLEQLKILGSTLLTNHFKSSPERERNFACPAIYITPPKPRCVKSKCELTDLYSGEITTEKIMMGEYKEDISKK